MIQRIQTVILGLIVLLNISLLKLPIYAKHSSDGTQHLKMDAWSTTLVAETKNTSNETIVKSQDLWFVAGLAVVIAAIALFSIFQYKNRLTQMKIGIGLNLLNLGLAICLFIVTKEVDKWVDPEKFGMQQAGFYIPFFSLLLTMAANRMIRKDQLLVKSMDRLR
jgi:ABC-type uncharacterized transport system permease subunit